MPGVELDLVDPERVQTFSFGNDHIVMCTFGTVDGDETGPAMSWRIDDDGTLVIFDDQSLLRLRKRCSGGTRVIVESAGQAQEYEATVRRLSAPE